MIRLCFAISQRGTFKAKIKIIINLSQSVFQICKNYHFLNWPLILFLKNDWKGIGRLSFWIIQGFRMLLLMKLMLLSMWSLLSLLMLLLLMVLFLMMILLSLYLMLMLKRKLQIETIKPRLFLSHFWPVKCSLNLVLIFEAAADVKIDLSQQPI